MVEGREDSRMLLSACAVSEDVFVEEALPLEDADGIRGPSSAMRVKIVWRGSSGSQFSIYSIFSFQ